MFLAAVLTLLPQEKIDLRQFLPSPEYKIVSTLQGDFIGLGHRQTAFVATAQDPGEADLQKGPFACIVSRGKVIWSHRCQDAAGVLEGRDDARPPLQAMDVTGDGHPELVFASASVGASGGTVSIHLIHWNGHSFVEVLPKGTALDMSLYESICYEPAAQPVVLHFLDREVNPKENGMAEAERRGLWKDRRMVWKGGSFAGGGVTQVRSPQTVLKRKGMRLIY